MNTTREKFIELLKNNEFDRTDLTVDEAKKLIVEKYPFIPKYDLSIFMASFDENDKFTFGEQAICTGDISEFIAEHDEDCEVSRTYEYFEDDDCNCIFTDCDVDDEPTFVMDRIIVCKDIVVINGYSTCVDDCSFVLYKKYN